MMGHQEAQGPMQQGSPNGPRSVAACRRRRPGGLATVASLDLRCGDHWRWKRTEISGSPSLGC